MAHFSDCGTVFGTPTPIGPSTHFNGSLVDCGARYPLLRVMPHYRHVANRRMDFFMIAGEYHGLSWAAEARRML